MSLPIGLSDSAQILKGSAGTPPRFEAIHHKLLLDAWKAWGCSSDSFCGSPTSSRNGHPLRANSDQTKTAAGASVHDTVHDGYSAAHAHSLARLGRVQLFPTTSRSGLRVLERDKQPHFHHRHGPHATRRSGIVLTRASHTEPRIWTPTEAPASISTSSQTGNFASESDHKTPYPGAVFANGPLMTGFYRFLLNLPVPEWSNSLAVPLTEARMECTIPSDETRMGG